MMQYFEVASVDVSLRKAMLDGVVNKLLQESGVSDAEVVFAGDDDDTQAQPESRVGHQQELTFGASNKVYVDFTETRNDDNRHARGVGLNREVPVFYDHKRNIQLQPVMTQYDVEMTLRRNSRSKDKLQRWLNRLNSLLDMGRASTVIDVEAYYFIPMPALELLHACWEAINTMEPQYDTYKDYLKTYLHKSVTVLSAQTGKQKRLAARFNATRVEVVYDTSPITKERNELNHQAELVVKFSYWRPDEMQCHHPVMLRQTYIADKWMPQPEPTYLSNDELAEISTIQWGYEELAKWGAVRLPYWQGGAKDALDIVTKARPDAEYPVWGTEIPFGEDNLTSPAYILNADEDLPYTWNEDIRKYIGDCREKDSTGKNCIINMMIYINRHPVDWKDLRWEGSELYYLKDINPDDVFYIVERVVVDWSKMNYDDLLILREHPDAVDRIINWLCPEIDRPDRLSSGRVDWDDFDKVVGNMTGDKSRERFMRAGYIAVMNTTILTFKEAYDGDR